MKPIEYYEVKITINLHHHSNNKAYTHPDLYILKERKKKRFKCKKLAKQYIKQYMKQLTNIL